MMQNLMFYLQYAMTYLRPALEILILAFLIYKILYHMRGTRGANVLAGLAILLMLLTFVSDFLRFEIISWLLNGLWALLATAIIVIFQPELRRAFAHLGSAPFQYRNRKKEAIAEVATAVVNMSKRKIGAIIVMERKIGMRAIVEDAVKLDVKLNSLIIESIFFPNSPLHDGAVIIKNNRIIAAHAILPLSRNETVARSLGTRHRAAVGITEETDAVVVVVSEETGAISIACRGSISRNIGEEKLLRYLTGLLITERDESFGDIFSETLDDDKHLTGFTNGEE